MTPSGIFTAVIAGIIIGLIARIAVILVAITAALFRQSGAK